MTLNQFLQKCVPQVVLVWLLTAKMLHSLVGHWWLKLAASFLLLHWLYNAWLKPTQHRHVVYMWVEYSGLFMVVM